MEYFKLNNGVEMPKLGFGVFQINDLSLCEEAVTNALNIGYRMIDTAAAYFNEEAVGNAIKKSAIPREDIFLVSKVWIQDFGYEKTKEAFYKTLEKLQTDYLDLYLIHQAYNNYYGAWKAMQDLYKEGKIRAIGVCNFNTRQLVDLISYNEIKPQVVQIEFNPIFQQKDFRKILEKYDIQSMSWGPFAEGKENIFNNTLLREIGKKYDKTPAQVMLRWNMDENSIVIPKSIHRERIKENYNIWDFKLDDEDVKKIESLDRNKSSIIDFDKEETVLYLKDFKIHD